MSGPEHSEPLHPDSLVDRYGVRIYRLARRMTPSDADAEDVTQSVFLKILRSADQYRGASDPMGWIYRIVVNEARDWHRRARRHRTVSLDDLPVEFDASRRPSGVSEFPRRPEDAAMRRELEARLVDAIDQLPDGAREAVILHDIEGLSYREAAEVLGLSLGGFKVRLHRARLHLRQRLQDVWTPGPLRAREAS